MAAPPKLPEEPHVRPQAELNLCQSSSSDRLNFIVILNEASALETMEKLIPWVPSSAICVVLLVLLMNDVILMAAWGAEGSETDAESIPKDEEYVQDTPAGHHCWCQDFGQRRLQGLDVFACMQEAKFWKHSVWMFN